MTLVLTFIQDRWADEIKAKRFFQIKNDGYWWESYSELEEEGLLDDVEIVPWDKRKPLSS